MNTEQQENFRKLIQAVDEYAQAGGAVNKSLAMGHYAFPCGTPSCVLGIYAAREDLQKQFYLVKGKDAVFSKFDHEIIYYADKEIQDHFGISEQDAEELFSGSGCNYAKTAFQALRYLKNFLETKLYWWLRTTK